MVIEAICGPGGSLGSVGSRSGNESTMSMPEITSPNAVYAPSRWGAASKTMKNWLPAELGSAVRAIDSTPRTCDVSLNSASIVYPGPPAPVPVGSPPWAMKPWMMRWKVTAS